MAKSERFPKKKLFSDSTYHYKIFAALGLLAKHRLLKRWLHSADHKRYVLQSRSDSPGPLQWFQGNDGFHTGDVADFWATIPPHENTSTEYAVWSGFGSKFGYNVTLQDRNGELGYDIGRHSPLDKAKQAAQDRVDWVHRRRQDHPGCPECDHEAADDPLNAHIDRINKRERPKPGATRL